MFLLGVSRLGWASLLPYAIFADNWWDCVVILQREMIISVRAGDNDSCGNVLSGGGYPEIVRFASNPRLFLIIPYGKRQSESDKLDKSYKSDKSDEGMWVGEGIGSVS